VFVDQQPRNPNPELCSAPTRCIDGSGERSEGPPMTATLRVAAVQVELRPEGAGT
jgi:hypothetical protein